MCGLFGMTIPRRYPTELLHRGDALTLLGELAEERGLDAAGVAARFHPNNGGAISAARRSFAHGEHVSLQQGQWLLEKCSGPFRRLARSGWLSGRLATAVTVIGHTRWATQGGLSVLNASPALTGGMYCTHNGDLAIDTIPYRPTRISPSSTDSAVLFAALATANRGRVNIRRLTAILTQMQGRAALAWADSRDDTGRVWLARAGLSPLAIADDVDGGLWWASNPAWLRQLSHTYGLPLRGIRLLPEGTLLSATPLQTTVRVTVHARFKPTVRPRDQRLLPGAVWRNFTADDQIDDLAIMRHRIAPRQLPFEPLPAHRLPARAQ